MQKSLLVREQAGSVLAPGWLEKGSCSSPAAPTAPAACSSRSLARGREGEESGPSCVLGTHGPSAQGSEVCTPLEATQELPDPNLKTF